MLGCSSSELGVDFLSHSSTSLSTALVSVSEMSLEAFYVLTKLTFEKLLIFQQTKC